MNQVTKFIKGTMSANEQEQILSAMIEAKLDRDKKTSWVKTLEAEHGVQRLPAQKFSKKRKRNWFLLSIAASILLLVGVLFVKPGLFQSGLQGPVDGHIAALAIMGDQSMLRKGSASIDVIRSKATQYYVNLEYEKSSQEWEKLVQAQQASASDYFYLGICELKKVPPNAIAAVAALQKSRGLESHEAEISWTLALAYIKAGEQANGIAELKAIVARAGYKAAEAAELLAIQAD